MEHTKEPHRHTAAATAVDPGSEAWTAILSHASVVQDSRGVCKLLQVSRSYAAAVHAQLAGRLTVQLTADTFTAARQFSAWMRGNSIILQAIRVSLTPADASTWCLPQPAATAVQARAAALIIGLMMLAGTHPAATQAPAAASLSGLRSFTAHGVPASSAGSLVASLSGVARQLTHLELSMLLQPQPEHWSEAPMRFPAHPPAIAALAGMTGLQSLLLHQACGLEPAMSGCIWPTLGNCLEQCVSRMTQLKQLELPVRIADLQSLGLLQQYLPAGLQELQLGADAVSEEDEGAIAFGFNEAEEILQSRKQQPLDFSHLTALTRLRLPVVAPIVAGDVLPSSLQQLQIRQCFDVAPLLQLKQLQLLSCRVSTIPALELQALTQLTSLTAVKLFYEGGYQLCGHHTHWSSQRVAEQAAVWAKLPLISLGLYEGSGPYEGGVFGPPTQELCVPIQQLQRLTYLSIDWPLECEVLAGLGKLTQLRRLSLQWSWFDEYVGSRWAEHTAEELAVGNDVVLRLMHAIRSLPHLQELMWLCDEDRGLCLRLEGLKGALLQLGAGALPGPEKVTLEELARVVELHMEEFDD